MNRASSESSLGLPRRTDDLDGKASICIGFGYLSNVPSCQSAVVEFVRAEIALKGPSADHSAAAVGFGATRGRLRTRDFSNENGWLPKNTVFQLFLSRFVNVSSPDAGP